MTVITIRSVKLAMKSMIKEMKGLISVFSVPPQ